MRARAIAHPNVALVKYWGKRRAAGNVPATGSLSITLGGLCTETEVEFRTTARHDEIILDGAPASAIAAGRVSALLDELRARAGVSTRARVVSTNDFPTGAGLASSASGFAALLLAASAALGLKPDAGELAELARHGSGSAPRSLHGGFATLRLENGSVRSAQLASPTHWPLETVVAVTATGPKETLSRDGMQTSANTSPFYPAWVETHEADLEAGIAAVRARDFERLAEVAEHSCLKMHAVMLATRPALVYWRPATLAGLLRVREMRAQGIPVFFTVDAGPQLKAICAPGHGATVARELAKLDGVLDVLVSPLGEGARVVECAPATVVS